MPPVLRRNRKGSNEQIVRMNAIGRSLAGIAEKFDCHPTSITLRLKSLNIPPADTRRAFMEEIFRGLPEGHQEHVADALVTEGTAKRPLSIKEYVQALVDQDVQKRVAIQEEIEAAEAAEKEALIAEASQEMDDGSVDGATPDEPAAEQDPSAQAA